MSGQWSIRWDASKKSKDRAAPLAGMHDNIADQRSQGLDRGR
jgi:hypothetical protein